MKGNLFLCGVAILLSAGCASNNSAKKTETTTTTTAKKPERIDIHHATKWREVDLTGGKSPSGSVEFYSAGNDSVIPIYSVDKNGDARIVSAVGLDSGSSFNYHRYMAPVATRLVVDTPTGDQAFLIDREGPLVKVPVSENKATPVEIIYKLLERGDVFDIYTAEVRIQSPGEPTPSPYKK